jgi:AcrR family transcriptional regulator
MAAEPRDDRRINRTKRALRQALVELMIEQGYERTSVQDLIDRADVGRSTFYAHYADKDALLRENISDLSVFLRSKSGKPTRSKEHVALSFSLPMLEHLAEVREVFLLQLGPRRDRTVQEYIHEMLCEVVREDLSSRAEPSATPAEVIVEFIVGTFMAVTSWWALKAPEWSPEEAHRVFVELISPSLERAAPAGGPSSWRVSRRAR